MRTFTLFCSALVLAALAATPANAVTRAEQARLQQLSPEVRQRVMDRMGPEQTVIGILETMLLNQVASMIDQPRSVRFVHENNTIVVTDAAGQSYTLRYNPQTWLVSR